MYRARTPGGKRFICWVTRAVRVKTDTWVVEPWERLCLNVQLNQYILYIYNLCFSLTFLLNNDFSIDVACVSMFRWGWFYKHSVNRKARWPFVANCRKRLYSIFCWRFNLNELRNLFSSSVDIYIDRNAFSRYHLFIFPNLLSLLVIIYCGTNFECASTDVCSTYRVNGIRLHFHG